MEAHKHEGGSIAPYRSLTGRVWRLRDGRMATDVSSEEPATILARLVAERKLDNMGGPPTPIDPKLLPDGQRAAARVRTALKNGEKIGVIGDYDCDGVTSAAQLVRMLRRHDCEPVVRLPHRVHDGYELKPAQADFFADAGVTVLLIADNGITAVKMTARAVERGIDVIVLDHHSVPAELPAAYALVHPALGNLPQPHPSAAGVVFTFLHLMDDAPWPGWESDLALATIGTVADLVPLTGGNRRLVRAGLDAMKNLPDGPIAQLIQNAGITGALTASDIAFRIAPRINAAGRMDDPTVALNALLHGGDALEAIAGHNTDRQELQHSLMDDAIVTAQAQADKPCICIAGAYPPGIIGLLAGKITDITGKPSIACSIDGDVCTGSLRSPACCSIIATLRRAAAAMGADGERVRFGGHAQAAGCTLPTSLLSAFHDALCADVAANTTPDDLQPTCAVDAAVDLRQVDTQFANALQELQPFGQGNPEPRFVLPQVMLEQKKLVGAEGRHLQARIGGRKAIGFGLGHVMDRCDEPLDILCRIGVDTWSGRKEVQVFIEDVRVSALVRA